MTPIDFERFRKMLGNEYSFDELFSDVKREDDFTLFYNKYFSDDPIFNHAVVSEKIMDSGDPSEEKILDVLANIKSAASGKQVPASIFVEEFWRHARKFEGAAVEFGFRVIEKMEIMSKVIGDSVMPVSGQIFVDETKDIEKWNATFVRSFGIVDTWRPELRSRGKLIVENSSTVLLLAREKEISAEASGCSLLHFFPEGLVGVYCVGTVPERRFKGVARSLMLKAESIAKQRKSNLILLQTLASDGVFPMYQKMGYGIDFERIVMQAS
ncbi:MAG: GNAT family N-acetyltransferase [Thaumarchaeota archaeon]|nr:GNAT family N-acetyltransferase [Nitrososphaerota archaeon]